MYIEHRSHSFGADDRYLLVTKMSISCKEEVYTVTVNNFSNVTKSNNHLVPQSIEPKKRP
jgi:hypothetical protein